MIFEERVVPFFFHGFCVQHSLFRKLDTGKSQEHTFTDLFRIRRKDRNSLRKMVLMIMEMRGRKRREILGMIVGASLMMLGQSNHEESGSACVMTMFEARDSRGGVCNVR